MLMAAFVLFFFEVAVCVIKSNFTVGMACELNDRVKRPANGETESFLLFYFI